MKHSREIKIGVLAVLCCVILYFGLNFLKGINIFSSTSTYVGQYENVSGLTEQAPVYIKGYKAGKVAEVDYDSENAVFYVTCSVLNDFSITEDSKMAIYSTDIMGSKGVKLILGTSEELIEDGDTLSGVIEAGLMDGLAESISPLLAKVSTTIDSLGTTVSGMNRLLSDTNTKSVSRTLKNLETTVANVKELSRTVKGKSGFTP